VRVCGGGVLCKEGQILLGRRSADRWLYPNMWDIFGGHCEADETPEEALIRECEEELRVRPLEFRKLAVFQEPLPALYGEAEYHVYVISRWSGKGPVNAGDEHSEIRWFGFEDVGQLELAWEGYRDLFQTLASALQGETREPQAAADS